VGTDFDHWKKPAIKEVDGMEDKSKLAAIAGVMAYIKEEEEAMCLAVSQAPGGAQVQAPAAPVKLWGVSGRQAMMQYRNLMQAKAFHGYR
jgi:hypothetical protein